MERRILGKTGMEVSIIGFGAAGMGFMAEGTDIAPRLLNEVLDSGVNVIDTAECYGSSEELIGNNIAQRRSEYYIFTKCGHASGFDYDDWDPRLLEKSIERSLKRLQTDYIDVVHLHSCSEAELKKGKVIEVLERFKKAGKIRFIGYSGDSKAALCAIECGAFDTLQTSVNIADQEAIGLTLLRAQERQMGVIAKRAIANTVWRNATRPQEAFYQPYWDRLSLLDFDFIKGNMDDAIRIALWFTLGQSGVHTALIGTNKPENWHKNAELASGEALSADQLKSIRDRWMAVAGPDWIAADESRPSLRQSVKKALLRVRRTLRGSRS
jgi:aryl-alcohol dehydrogenase-like predicted oxidoreductase